MLGLLELLGFPPHPFAVAAIGLCALFWGLRSRRKNRPYLLAVQAALVSCLISTLGLSFQAGGSGLSGLGETVLRITLGQMIMYWTLSWIIISLVFTIRGRNDNANIFTRNRNK